MLINCTSYNDDDEILHSLGDDNSAFRVTVQLERYFKDSRSRCYIMIGRRGQVSYLEHRIKTIFNLPGSFCLRTNGYLLPSHEPISVIVPGDVIE